MGVRTGISRNERTVLAVRVLRDGGSVRRPVLLGREDETRVRDIVREVDVKLDRGVYRRRSAEINLEERPDLDDPFDSETWET